MKRGINVILLLAILFSGCEKATENSEKLFTAEIVDYDLNCLNCILTFPYEMTAIRKILGKSDGNYYQAVNLKKNDFAIGEMVKVKVRPAVNQETQACITMYPSFSYKSIYVSECIKCRVIRYNEQIDLPLGTCLSDPVNNTYICFDSVLTDSRCPKGVQCVWAGEAIARFDFKTCSGEVTHADLKAGTMDNPAGGYRLSFIDLLPYPTLENLSQSKNYIARIIIKREQDR